jgi:hypothetical protein
LILIKKKIVFSLNISCYMVSYCFVLTFAEEKISIQDIID